jgi:hypothetical protein
MEGQGFMDLFKELRPNESITIRNRESLQAIQVTVCKEYYRNGPAYKIDSCYTLQEVYNMRPELLEAKINNNIRLMLQAVREKMEEKEKLRAQAKRKDE